MSCKLYTFPVSRVHGEYWELWVFGLLESLGEKINLKGKIFEENRGNTESVKEYREEEIV